MQVDYEAPYAPPLADANLQLLAINFSAYAVKVPCRPGRTRALTLSAQAVPVFSRVARQ